MLVPCRGMAAHGAGRSARPHLGKVRTQTIPSWNRNTATCGPTFAGRSSSAASGRLTPCLPPRPLRVWSPSSSPPAPERASAGPVTSSTPPSPTVTRWSSAPSAPPSHQASGRWWWSPPDSSRRHCTQRWSTSSTSAGPPARSHHYVRGSPPPSRSVPMRSSSASATSPSSASTHGGRSPRWTPRSPSPPTAAGADTRCDCDGTRGTCCRRTATRALGRSSSVDPIS